MGGCFLPGIISFVTGNLFRLTWGKNWTWLNRTSQRSEETSVNTMLKVGF